MEVHFTPEQESQLRQIARYAGIEPERLLRDAALRMLEDRTCDRFRTLPLRLGLPHIDLD